MAKGLREVEGHLGGIKRLVRGDNRGLDGKREELARGEIKGTASSLFERTSEGAQKNHVIRTSPQESGWRSQESERGGGQEERTRPTNRRSLLNNTRTRKACPHYRLDEIRMQRGQAREEEKK